MNNLPQELVEKISSYLGRDDLKNTLLLSRQFQHASERYSGAFSAYELTKDNVDHFLHIYSGQRFFRYLRQVKLRTSVHALDGKRDEDNPCRDSAEELKELDEEFTRQIKFLFSTIQELETHAATVHKLGPGSIELTIYTPTRAIDREQHCLHRVLTSWRIHLLSPESLPNLASVQSLWVETGAIMNDYEPRTPFRKLDLRVILDLANKLPNLKFLNCCIGGDEWMTCASSEEAIYVTQDWAGPRRDSRHDFVKGYNSIALRNLRHARLDFIYPLQSVDLIDQRVAMPDFVGPGKYDIFSTSLRLLSYQLRTMTLRVIADSTLFWPADGTIPFWPNLEGLSVMFYIADPSGSWYFRGLNNEGESEGFEVTARSYPPLETTDEDEEADDDFDWMHSFSLAQYRVIPNDEVLVPFLTAFAKAAALMPSLKQAALWTPLKFKVYWEEYEDFDVNEVSKYADGRLAWGLAYGKPGTEAVFLNPGEDFSAIRQIWWKVGKWRPDAELLDLFREIGRKEHGRDLEMYWEDAWAGSGLVTRHCFDSWEGGVFENTGLFDFSGC